MVCLQQRSERPGAGRCAEAQDGTSGRIHHGLCPDPAVYDCRVLALQHRPIHFVMNVNNCARFIPRNLEVVPFCVLTKLQSGQRIAKGGDHQRRIRIILLHLGGFFNESSIRTIGPGAFICLEVFPAGVAIASPYRFTAIAFAGDIGRLKRGQCRAIG